MYRRVAYQSNEKALTNVKQNILIRSALWVPHNPHLQMGIWSREILRKKATAKSNAALLPTDRSSFLPQTIKRCRCRSQRTSLSPPARRNRSTVTRSRAVRSRKQIPSSPGVCARSKFGASVRPDVSRPHEKDPGAIRCPFENRCVVHDKQLVVRQRAADK